MLYGYAVDLAIVDPEVEWTSLERTLYLDMATLSSYLRKWRLKLSKTKNVSTAFHLKKGKRSVNGRRSSLPYNPTPTYNPTPIYNPTPTYLGVTLDRNFTYQHHLQTLHKKLTSRIAFISRLAGRSWGACATALRNSTIALVHYTSEYCAPVWYRSAHTHMVDKPINDALRIVTGCLKPIPTENYQFSLAYHLTSSVVKAPPRT